MKHKVFLAAAAALCVAAASFAADGALACALVTPGEIEALTGTKLEMKGVTVGASNFCSARTPALGVMIRMAQRVAGAADKESAGIAIARKMGARIDVKKYGPITCSTIIPPKEKEMYGYNTTCSIAKGTAVAAIEVTTQKREAMVPMEKMHALAEKVAKRF
jgi:hypothetical protein